MRHGRMWMRGRRWFLGVALCGALGAFASAGEDAAAGLKALEQQYEVAEGSYPDKFAAVKAEALLALAIADRSAEPESSKQRFADLRDRFGDVKRRGVIPYSEYADAHLTPHEKAALAVGQKAPEIVGRDLDGNPLKLSDHLGKVVVLDFWGDW